MIIPIWLRKFIPERMKKMYRDTREKMAWDMIFKSPIRIPQVWDDIGLIKKMAEEHNQKVNPEMKWQAQIGQDYFIYNFVFNQKSNGIFLDIGANDPIKISNTYALEKRGWTGLAIEPQLQFQERWQAERKCECIPVCLGGMDNVEVDFFESTSSVFSGINGVVDNKLEGKICKKQQRTLNSILAERSISEIDFMSLDVEGYEMQVLSGVDLDKVNIRCITIENPRSLKEKYKLRKYMADRGYTWYAKVMWDDVFVRQDYLELIQDQKGIVEQ